MLAIDFLKEQHVKNFIQDNVLADVNKLILNPPAGFSEHIKDISNQIKSRQKAKNKLKDWSTNFELIMPPPISIEQASSKVTSEYKKTILSGQHLVDLTGGMGIDCVSLSDAFEHTTYVERQAELCEIFKHNMQVLGKTINVVNDTAENYLKTFKTKSDQTIAYLDPARRDDAQKKVFKIENCSPDLKSMMPLLKKTCSEVLIKFSPLLDIKSVLETLSYVETVHVVSVKNECKELLIMIDFAFDGEPGIKCVNLETEHPNYDFAYTEEKEAKVSYSEPKAYIYEPNSSIMKAGAFRKICLDYELDKFGQHTHLYTSNWLSHDFPGRVYKVTEQLNKLNLRKYAPEGKINVVTRNYPLRPDELKRKWKLKDGGDYFVLAFRDHKDKTHQLIATRVD